MAMTDSESGGIGGSGYSLDDLADYLDRGKTPPIAAIDANPACEVMLSTLVRLRSLSRELVVQDEELNPTLDEGWISNLVRTIERETRAGRDIPLATSDPLTTLSITEGAIRELVRAAGDSVDGVLVGRCTIDGDLTERAASLSVSITISVVLSEPVLELAKHVRERVHSELLRHTQLNVAAIDVTVVDVREMTTQSEGDEQ
jgi:uncharacterized alkaline shock family protein YloU